MASQQTVTVFEKPIQHLSLADWNARVTQLRNVSDLRRADAFALRHTARTLRNETKIQTGWETYHNDNRLSDRVAELDRWRVTMESCLDRIDKETKLLKDEKVATELEMEALQAPLSIVAECLTMRDCRLGAELTYDDGDTELKKELCVLESNQKQLREQCQAAWEKLNRLGEIRFQVALEIENKKEAQAIDRAQMELDSRCANITYKPDATRYPRGAISYESWLDHSKQMSKLADHELEDAYAMRESLFCSREKARNLLNAQQERTEHTIRKRIFDTQRSRNELEWQMLKMREEMEKCIEEIHTLEGSWADMDDALKLAETRLENRAQRSGKELCMDEPYLGLCQEIQQLKKTKQMLIDKLNCTKTTYCALEALMIKLGNSLEQKEHALMTDIRGLDLRKRLQSSNKICDRKTKTDRNIKLTKMESEIPPT